MLNKYNITNIDKWERFALFNQLRTDKHIEECSNIYDFQAGEYSENMFHAIYKHINNGKSVAMEGIKIVYIL